VDHSCAILGADRRVYCWGSGSLGALGQDAATGPDACGCARCSRRPLEIQGIGPGVVDLPDAGIGDLFRQYAAIRSDGTAFSWGMGSSAHAPAYLYRAARDEPTWRGATDVAAGRYPVVGSILHEQRMAGLKDVRMVSGSTLEALCALLGDGRVACVSNGDPENVGMLGAGTKPRCGDKRACEVAGVEGAIYIDSYWSGTGAACAVVGTGAVFCWGTAPGFTPEATRVTGFEHAARVSVGPAHVCIVNDRGQARCIARPERGAGNARDAFFSAPSTAIAGLPPITELAIQYSHSCARTDDDRVVCWGQNEQGQLGTGDTKARERPVEVASSRRDVRPHQRDDDDVCRQGRKGRRWTPSDEQVREALSPIWSDIKHNTSIEWPSEPIEYVVFDYTGALVDVRLARNLYPPGRPGALGPLAWVVASLFETRVPEFCQRRVRIDNPVSRLRLDAVQAP
jgi:hypothetical protein